MNKPVAWIGKNELQLGFTDTRVTNDKESWDDIPLYTHPVKEQELLDEIAQLKHINRNWQISENILLLELEKLQMRELTDEEIYRLLADSIWAVGLNTDCLDEQNWADGITVARAILRKAQEK